MGWLQVWRVEAGRVSPEMPVSERQLPGENRQSFVSLDQAYLLAIRMGVGKQGGLASPLIGGTVTSGCVWC